MVWLLTLENRVVDNLKLATISILKINYKVDRINENEIENEIYNFISPAKAGIQENKNKNDKKLVSVSVRISYRPILDKRQEYKVLFTNNIDINNFNPLEILNEFKSKVENRKVANRKMSLRDIISLHLHLFYV